MSRDSITYGAYYNEVNYPLPVFTKNVPFLASLMKSLAVLPSLLLVVLLFSDDEGARVIIIFFEMICSFKYTVYLFTQKFCHVSFAYMVSLYFVDLQVLLKQSLTQLLFILVKMLNCRVL